MTNSNTLREAIIKLLYEEAPDTPWLTDAFYDNLLSLIESEFQKRKMDKVSEALGLVKSTAKGALVASERDGQAMKKAMETIGLLNSMVLSGEQHTETSRKTMEGAIVDLLHAMQFKADAPKNGASLGAWAGTPEMADEFLRQNPSHSSL